MMVIPLLIGCAVNTFVPQCLEIGGFTTALFKSGQSTLVGLFIFCSGATINVKQVGKPLYKGAVLTILKLVIGVIIGYLLNLIFGPAGILGLTPFAVISAVTNSNGAIYTALAKEFGDDTDVGAIAVLSLNDGPFLTMIALGTTGLASIPVLSIVAAINQKLCTYLKAKQIKENLENSKEKLSSEDDYTETINEIEQNIEDIKNHLVDDNMVVKKGTDGITVKLFPQ